MSLESQPPAPEIVGMETPERKRAIEQIEAMREHEKRWQVSFATRWGSAPGPDPGLGAWVSTTESGTE